MTSSEKGEKNRIQPGTLYLVATPIGNLSDISERALKILSGVDFVAAEDTRNTARLLSAFGITKPMICYFEHNKRQRGDAIIKRLGEGESCALVTDAGTPAVSDPGADLVRECINTGLRVSSVPGACAAITALTLSGMDTRRFVFEGFLSAVKSERRARLEELCGETRTLIIYEAPHRLKATLNDMNDVFGNRDIALCRELTKINEEVMRCTLPEAVAYYSENDPRGEYVLIIGGALKSEQEQFWAEMSIDDHIAFYIDKGMSKMDAIKQTARDRGVPKNEIYKQTIK